MALRWIASKERAANANFWIASDSVHFLLAASCHKGAELLLRCVLCLLCLPSSPRRAIPPPRKFVLSLGNSESDTNLGKQVEEFERDLASCPLSSHAIAPTPQIYALIEECRRRCPAEEIERRPPERRPLIGYIITCATAMAALEKAPTTWSSRELQSERVCPRGGGGADGARAVRAGLHPLRADTEARLRRSLPFLLRPRTEVSVLPLFIPLLLLAH